MPVLAVGGTTYEVQASGASQAAGDTSDPSVRTFAGTLRRQSRWRKREWQFVTAPIAQSAFITLETAVTTSSYQTCTGTSLPGGSVVCEVTITGASYVQDTSDANGFKRIATLRLREK